ncbi:hypothetical protein ANCCAN_15515 [Ancylostoma caninum]|uniref:Uncharacterized protein n=1 Tax=Ancylostoma caninum TaxID=29170 RepID=A0A368G6G1_ANCCA|nr:hypothetical protein ANCCAN_15515 [Ancylostoma caninum]
MMQARKIRYDAIGLIETRRHWPLSATIDTGVELFLGTCDRRGVGGVGVHVNTNLVMNIDSFEQEVESQARHQLGSLHFVSRFWEDAVVDNIDEEYDRLVQHLRDNAKKAGSRASKIQDSYETLELMRQRGAARAAGN